MPSNSSSISLANKFAALNPHDPGAVDEFMDSAHPTMEPVDHTADSMAEVQHAAPSLDPTSQPGTHGPATSGSDPPGGAVGWDWDKEDTTKVDSSDVSQKGIILRAEANNALLREEADRNVASAKVAREFEMCLPKGLGTIERLPVSNKVSDDNYVCIELKYVPTYHYENEMDVLALACWKFCNEIACVLPIKMGVGNTSVDFRMSVHSVKTDPWIEYVVHTQNCKLTLGEIANEIILVFRDIYGKAGISDKRSIISLYRTHGGAALVLRIFALKEDPTGMKYTASVKVRGMLIVPANAQCTRCADKWHPAPKCPYFFADKRDSIMCTVCRIGRFVAARFNNHRRSNAHKWAAKVCEHYHVPIQAEHSYLPPDQPQQQRRQPAGRRRAREHVNTNTDGATYRAAVQGQAGPSTPYTPPAKRTHFG